MKSFYIALFFIYPFLASCSREYVSSKHLILESHAPVLVSNFDVFGHENNRYAEYIASGNLTEGDFIWEVFSRSYIDLDCDLNRDLNQLIESEDNGEGNMILSPYENFFVLSDKKKFYGISIKRSDNTLKIETIYPVENKDGFFRSKAKEKIVVIVDLEYIQNNNKCVSSLIKKLLELSPEEPNHKGTQGDR